MMGALFTPRVLSYDVGSLHYCLKIHEENVGGFYVLFKYNVPPYSEGLGT